MVKASVDFWWNCDLCAGGYLRGGNCVDADFLVEISDNRKEEDCEVERKLRRRRRDCHREE